MSVDNPTNIPDSANDIVDSLVEGVQEKGKGILHEFLKGAKKWLEENQDFPFVKEILSLFDSTKEKTSALAAELEVNSQGIQGSYDRFKGFFEKYTEMYEIPEGYLLNLVNKEGSKFFTGAKAEGSSAFGLGQITKGTWNDVRDTILKRDGYDIGPHGTTSPDAQLYATAEYLSQMSKISGWEHALAYYNTGPGIKDISTEKALEYSRINPAISNLIPGVKVKGGKILEGEQLINPDSYFHAAVLYYKPDNNSRETNTQHA